MMPAFAAFATRADGTIQQDHYVIATFVLYQRQEITPCSNLRWIGFHVLRVHQRQGHDLREHVRRARRAAQKEARVVTHARMSISFVHIARTRNSTAPPAAGSSLMYICVHLANAATGVRRRGSWRADVSVEECSWELTSSSSRAACGRRDRSAALSLRRRQKRRI